VPGLALIDRLRHPTQLVLAAFTGLIIIGSALLRLPFAFEGPHPGFVDALFTSTSAVTVTGLATFDIERLSLFGELVVLALVQIGGFGIMTIGSVLGLVASRRVGLRQRMLAHTEIGGVELGQVRSLLSAIARITIAVEASLAVVLFLRLWQSDAEPVGRAAYSGVFHAVTAFNNAGFSLYSDSLRRFVGDAWICMPISLGIIIGGLGFPILVELERRCPPRQWSLHARITLGATVLLLVVAPLIVLIFEWTNPATLGELSGGDKVLAGWFQGVTPRTAGFETVPYGEMNEPTQTVTAALMFVGAGPASTSGGIKVTTFAVLGFVLWAEVRGETEVNVLRRRLPGAIVRQAVTVALLSIGVVAVTSLALVAVEDVTLTPALFEASSAFGTVGLTTGLTTALSTFAKLMLAVVMLLGRVGPVTFVTALALRERGRAYRYPEERPIIG
jgi:trk system potassium uptake protein TrkH